MKVFSILGQKVLETTFSSTGVSDINLPILNTGVYIVNVSSEKGKTSKKIVIE
ncbi:T9SS type A sorting domain-containing protein [uncultured Polaribacter sp.]|uniref:T9SS type A sorting domain-containing protein n=1 Tax=uncultured Polaribacter sp. TaxID=174711 RepID=UPI00338EEF5C